MPDLTDAPPHPGDADAASRRLLNHLIERYGGPVQLGCSLVAHRDIAFCAACVATWMQRNPAEVADRRITDPSGFPAAIELSGWRLLAMARHGLPDQPWAPIRPLRPGQ